MTRIRVAAVQPTLRLGAPEANLSRVEDLIRDAHREHAPDVIVLPDGLTTPNVYHPALRLTAAPIDGALIQLLSRLARELDAVLAGGAVSIRNRDTYGTYMVAEPSGRIHLHDNDLPAGAERHFYRGGRDSGLTRLETLGNIPVGLSSGSELARTRTARRIAQSRAWLAMGGTCWRAWSTEGGLLSRVMQREQEHARRSAHTLPLAFARSIGAPVIHASTVGEVPTRAAFMHSLRFETRLIGDTQIVDRDGTTLARMTYEDGEGHISADLTLSPPAILDPLPESYWLLEPSTATKAAFWAGVGLGAADYRLRKLGRRHQWQRWPSSDLPNEIVTTAGGRLVHGPLPTSISRTGLVKPRMTDAVERRFDLRVSRVQPVADDVVRVDLAAPDDQPLPRWRAGAHLDVSLGNGMVRQYSLCGDMSDRRRYSIAVLRELDGRGGSEWIHTQLGRGDILSVTGPRNHFRLADSGAYVFIAGGIGITPIMAMIDEVETAGLPWTLTYGGRTRASMAFADDLTERYGDRVTVVPENELGYIDLEQLLARPRPNTLVYACGPPPLLEAVERACQHWPDGSLRVERFVARQADPNREDMPFEVRLERTGITLRVSAQHTILDAVDEADVHVPSTCREGICGTCRTRVLEGDLDHRDSVLDDEERRAGNVAMICVSRCRSPRLVLDL